MSKGSSCEWTETLACIFMRRLTGSLTVCVAGNIQTKHFWWTEPFHVAVNHYLSQKQLKSLSVGGFQMYTVTDTCGNTSDPLLLGGATASASIKEENINSLPLNEHCTPNWGWFNVSELFPTLQDGMIVQHYCSKVNFGSTQAPIYTNNPTNVWLNVP